MPNTDTTYNGWTNYATWLVMLELFDGFDPDGQWQTAESVEDMADEWVAGDMRSSEIALDYARAFLNGVDWHEIANAINENHELTNPEED